MARKPPPKSKSKSKSRTQQKSRTSQKQKRATSRKYDDNPQYVKVGNRYVKLTEKEAKGQGLLNNYKKARKVVRELRKDPLDRLGISRRKFMKTRLGRRLLELSAKALQRDYGLLDDLIERFKESRS